MRSLAAISSSSSSEKSIGSTELSAAARSPSRRALAVAGRQPQRAPRLAAPSARLIPVSTTSRYRAASRPTCVTTSSAGCRGCARAQTDDAERAPVVAAILNFQNSAACGRRWRPRPAPKGMPLARRCPDVDVSEMDVAMYGAPAGAARSAPGWRVCGCCPHPFTPGMRPAPGRALRVATGDQDPRRRVLTVHAPYGLPHVFIGATVTVQVFSTTKSAAERSPVLQEAAAPATIPAPASACVARHPKFGRRISPPCYLL